MTPQPAATMASLFYITKATKSATKATPFLARSTPQGDPRPGQQHRPKEPEPAAMASLICTKGDPFPGHPKTSPTWPPKVDPDQPQGRLRPAPNGDSDRPQWRLRPAPQGRPRPGQDDPVSGQQYRPTSPLLSAPRPNTRRRETHAVAGCNAMSS